MKIRTERKESKKKKNQKIVLKTRIYKNYCEIFKKEAKSKQKRMNKENPTQSFWKFDLILIILMTKKRTLSNNN